MDTNTTRIQMPFRSPNAITLSIATYDEARLRKKIAELESRGWLMVAFSNVPFSPQMVQMVKRIPKGPPPSRLATPPTRRRRRVWFPKYSSDLHWALS